MIYAQFVTELAWPVMEEQIIIVYHAKVTVLFLGLHAYAIAVEFYLSNIYNFYLWNINKKGYFDDNVSDLCIICDRACLTCTGGTNNNCLSCKINSSLQGT